MTWLIAVVIGLGLLAILGLLGRRFMYGPPLHAAGIALLTGTLLVPAAIQEGDLATVVAAVLVPLAMSGVALRLALVRRRAASRRDT